MVTAKGAAAIAQKVIAKLSLNVHAVGERKVVGAGQTTSATSCIVKTRNYAFPLSLKLS